MSTRTSPCLFPNYNYNVWPVRHPVEVPQDLGTLVLPHLGTAEILSVKDKNKQSEEHMYSRASYACVSWPQRSFTAQTGVIETQVF